MLRGPGAFVAVPRCPGRWWPWCPDVPDPAEKAVLGEFVEEAILSAVMIGSLLIGGSALQLAERGGWRRFGHSVGMPQAGWRYFLVGG